MLYKKIIFIISKIIGINPLNLNNSRSSSILDYALMFFVPICYIVTLIFVLFFDGISMQIDGCKSICFIGNMVFIILGAFSYVICLCSSLNRKRFFSHFYNELNQLDEHLEKCNPLKKFIFKKDYVQIIMVLIMILTLFAVLIYDFLYLQKYYYSDLKKLFILIVTCYFPIISNSILQLIFVSLVKDIGRKYEQINCIFKLINKECDKQSNRVGIFDIEMSSNNNKTPNKLIQLNKNDEIEKEKEMENETFDNFNYITDFNHDNLNCEQFMVPLFHIHEKISTLGEVTNNEYATQIVVFMTSTFIVSIFGIFLTTKVLFTIGGQNIYLDKMAITFILWTLFLIVVAFLVLRLCCHAQTESRKTALLTHEIIQKKPSFMLGNDEYYNKMKCFTLQYLHWEYFFRFNGIGLFQLDYTFIFSAVSAATSYLIVLLQFDMTKAL